MRAVDSSRRPSRGANAETVELDNPTPVDDVAMHDDELARAEAEPGAGERDTEPRDVEQPGSEPLRPEQPGSEQDDIEPDGVAPDGMAPDGMAPDGMAQDDVAHDHVAQPNVGPEDVERGVPGDQAEGSEELWSGQEVAALRDRWREVQLRFVDDPRAAADEAASIVDEARQGLAAAIDSRYDELGKWRTADKPAEGDTEQLRVVVQRYRTFLDRVLQV
jgi:hypothetical protein